MGGCLGKKSTRSSQAIQVHLISQYSAELDSYGAACEVDPSLHSFDAALKARTSRTINTISDGVEVQVASIDSLKEVTECLMQMNQEVVQVMIECKKDIWKNRALFNLVEDYFENSLQTIDFCTELGNCPKRARDRQFHVHMALKQFEEEETYGERNYVETLKELRNFKADGDPFTEELFQIFQSAYKNQITMLEKLKIQRKKLKKKLKYIHSLRKVSNIIFVGTVASVLICTLVAAAVAAQPVAAALSAAASLPFGAVGNWISSLWKNYEKTLKEQKVVISSMQAGTYVAIKDLDHIRVLIDRVETEIGSLMRSADFATEEAAVKVGTEEIRKKLETFMKNVVDLGAQADICSREIRRARTVVLQRVINN